MLKDMRVMLKVWYDSLRGAAPPLTFTERNRALPKGNLSSDSRAQKRPELSKAVRYEDSQKAVDGPKSSG